jgi:hypothetical protein
VSINQLEALLSSRQFRSSRRCRSLLQFVTEKALEGDTQAFKERTLGVLVFGQVPDYDTNEHPVVRATASEVRKKLAQYYQEPEHEGEIRIAMQPGSYAPEFHVPDLPAPAAVENPKLEGSKRDASKRWRIPRVRVLIAPSVALTVAAAIFIAYPLNRSPLDQFWGRASVSPSVLICMGQPPAYNFRSDKKQTELSKLMEHPSAESLAASQQLIPLSELIPMPDRYMALGDAICLLRLATYFEKRGTAYYIRGNSATTFTDLREHPAVLVGAFDNEWTMRFGGQLRYSFYKTFDDPQGVVELIRDRDHPERTNWKLLNAWPEWNVSTDYALIIRSRDRVTDRMLVVAAGITQYGTVAAGEFITKPEYFAEAAAQLPPDWARKNLQIVLQVPVMNGASGHPHVLATYVW